MSHQAMLQPVILTPQVKPQKAEPRKNRIQARGADSLGGVTAETFDTIGFHQTLLPDNFVPIEGAERKPRQPPGRLSDNTLKAMLQAQEFVQQEIA
jgi:hypothetical protein